MQPTVSVPFSAEQMKWYEQACARIDPKRLQYLLFDLTNIHSPTGAAGAASQFMARHLESVGLSARYQPMSATSGNVLAERRGSGGGASVLLYAPIDTHLEEGDEAQEILTGKAPEADMQITARMIDDWVFGLGASNPKGMVATLTEVATALIEAEVPLVGDLLVGMADGGMPVDIAGRDHAGMSNGVFHLLNRGGSPDFAVIMKPWNWVYHEEPGMAWFKLRVHGTLGYAGVPRDIPGFRSSVVPAATVIQELERWIIDYAERNTSGQIKPHGWIAGVRGGDVQRPAFPSAVTEIFFDVRVNPRSSPADVKAQFAAFVRELQAQRPELDLDWEMYGSVAGGSTDPQNWIIQSCRRGWEHIEHRPHGQADLLGGQTDGAALRRLGIPTARIGWPWPAQGAPLPVAEGLGGMGATYVPDLIPCAKKIMYALIDTLTRPRHELGL
ncbi:Acetylornithine deacetylase [Pseudomonas sp. OF001]|jgi:acetylornithine deacetylase/succinyl-diaminopimelate desuccinylase-like protein|uniref:M20 family metallopeptidase n=1 Tax=Pseudomonas sp. OF001 TaxID=2772300 RepID=UPI00191B8E12|nr:acetylornithine deacetylase [Pseudomonas sp. OF001]CAD5379593.1 Acetylornithine deacetylase [Pseudomonas sp. OF001]